jgi:hypothetical protein
MNATRTLQAVSQAVLNIPGITGWEIMDVLAGGVGVSDTVFTVRFCPLLAPRVEN